MKSLKTLLLIAALAGGAGFASSASAQYKPVGGDGITASPRVRQMLDERAASGRATHQPQVQVKFKYQGIEPIAASPKARQMFAERRLVVENSDSGLLAGYRPTGVDGITASPKLRQQLDERATPIIVAPVK